MKKNFFKEAKFEYEGQRFMLEYCLTEENDGLSGQNVYGVGVRMEKVLPDGQVLKEGKQILPVFRSKNTAEELAELLSGNDVFPISLYEVTTEYILNKIHVCDMA